ncbi:hypothetical protein IAT38_001990 [Cryptococcus sp. DSM 104549]
MSANPPILAVPPQVPSPTSNIHRYLSSIRPHSNEHANIGVATFEREIREGLPANIGSDRAEEKEVAGRDGVGRKRGSSEERGSDWVMTRAEVMARLDSQLYQAGRAKYQATHFQSGPSSKTPISSPSSSPHRQPPLQQPSKVKPPVSRPLDDQPPQTTSKFPLSLISNLTKKTSHREDTGTGRQGKRKKGEEERDFEEVETESAQRRLERKLRRREKAAIVKPKPKPPTPPPARPKAKPSRKHAAPSIDGTLEGSQSGEEDTAGQRRKKGARRRAIPEFVKSYQAKNVFPVEGRITNKPTRKQGFLSHGKASLPILLPSEKTRLVPPQPFSEKLFLGGPTAVPSYPDDDDNVRWKAKRPSRSHAVDPSDQSQRRSISRAPALPLPRTIATTHTHSLSSLPSSTPDRRPTSFSRLPPPGLTASPSWHTEVSEREKERERRSRTGLGAGSLRAGELDRREASLSARSLRMDTPGKRSARAEGSRVGMQDERARQRADGQPSRELDEMLAEGQWRWPKNHSSVLHQQARPRPFVHADQVEAEAENDLVEQPPSLPPANTIGYQRQPHRASSTATASTPHPVARLPPRHGEAPSFGARRPTPTYAEDQPLWMPHHHEEEGRGSVEGGYAQEAYREEYRGDQYGEEAYGGVPEAEHHLWPSEVGSRHPYHSRASHHDYSPYDNQRPVLHTRQLPLQQPHPAPFLPPSIRPLAPPRPQMVPPSVNHTFDPDLFLPRTPATHPGYSAAYLPEDGYAPGRTYAPHYHASGLGPEPGREVLQEPGRDVRRDDEVGKFGATEEEWQKLWAERNWLR